MSELSDIIQQIANLPNQELDTKLCKIDSVDTAKRTVDVTLLNDDDVYKGVRLQSKISSAKGFVMFPKVGSKVVIELINRDEAYVSMMEEVDSVLVIVGNSTLEIKDDEILLTLDLWLLFGKTPVLIYCPYPHCL